MRIGIDVRCLCEGRRTGVEEYTLNLLENIFKIDGRNQYVLFFNSYKKKNVDFSWALKHSNVKLKRFRFPNKILNLCLWYLGWPKIDRMIGGADVFFAPNIFFGTVEKKTKLVSVIHDLSFERHPEYFSLKRRIWHIFINAKKICRRSDAVVCVSESTEEDVSSLYGVSSEKISVVPSGVSSRFRPIDRNNPRLLEVKGKYSLPFNFFLYFGTVEPRKNIVGIIRAYNSFRESQGKFSGKDFSRYKLVIAGQKGWLAENIFRERELSPFREDILMIGPVDEDDKEYVYNLASVFIFPSFFEGFGFPPLEAMACGVPVVCSNNSSLPEVAGGAAILIDPDRPEEIFSVLRAVLEDRLLREKMIQKGLEKSRFFSWEKAARKMIGVFEKTCFRKK